MAETLYQKIPIKIILKIRYQNLHQPREKHTKMLLVLKKRMNIKENCQNLIKIDHQGKEKLKQLRKTVEKRGGMVTKK